MQCSNVPETSFRVFLVLWSHLGSKDMFYILNFSIGNIPVLSASWIIIRATKSSNGEKSVVFLASLAFLFSKPNCVKHAVRLSFNRPPTQMPSLSLTMASVPLWYQYLALCIVGTAFTFSMVLICRKTTEAIFHHFFLIFFQQSFFSSNIKQQYLHIALFYLYISRVLT